jgi:hypothetical protein
MAPIPCWRCQRCPQRGKSLIQEEIQELSETQAAAILAECAFCLPPSKRGWSWWLQPIARDCRHLQHERVIPVLHACAGNSIAIDSHAVRRVVAASRILFLAPKQIAFSLSIAQKERGPEFPSARTISQFLRWLTCKPSPRTRKERFA